MQPGVVGKNQADPAGAAKLLFKRGADGSPCQPADLRQGGRGGAQGGGLWPVPGLTPPAAPAKAVWGQVLPAADCSQLTAYLLLL